MGRGGEEVVGRCESRCQGETTIGVGSTRIVGTALYACTVPPTQFRKPGFH